MSSGFLNLNMVVEDLSKAFKTTSLNDKVASFVSNGLCKLISQVYDEERRLQIQQI
jgi:hypothetical protein